MSRIVKIITDCAFIGSDTTHYCRIPDTYTKEDVEELAQELLDEDIQAGYFIDEEDVTDDEAYNEGYSVESYVDELEDEDEDVEEEED